MATPEINDLATARVEYPSDFVSEFTPLEPGIGWGEEFDATLNELAKHGFVAAIGFHEDFVDDVSKMSDQEHIAEFCPNDFEKRFGDKEKVQGWLKKGRVMVGIYAVKGWERGHDLSGLSFLRTGDLEQVAYGWFGPELVKNESGEEKMEITTAYRVGESGRQLSRDRRLDQDDKFKLGLPLGRLVIAAATKIYGVDDGDITLETWASNEANKLYDILDFDQTGSKPDEPRPTRKPVGTKINGNVVYFDPEMGRNMVKDTRLYKVLARNAIAA